MIDLENLLFVVFIINCRMQMKDAICFDRYARAFMLDLFSSVMFPDHSGYIQTMWVQFLHNVRKPKRYAWGAAVLAYLYRALCAASELKAKEICGPLVFLQMWLWTRFPIGRPKPNRFTNGLEGRPLGAMWIGRRIYHDDPHRSVSLYRLISEPIFLIFRKCSN